MNTPPGDEPDSSATPPPPPEAEVAAVPPAHVTAAATGAAAAVLVPAPVAGLGEYFVLPCPEAKACPPVPTDFGSALWRDLKNNFLGGGVRPDSHATQPRGSRGSRGSGGPPAEQAPVPHVVVLDLLHLSEPGQADIIVQLIAKETVVHRVRAPRSGSRLLLELKQVLQETRSTVLHVLAHGLDGAFSDHRDPTAATVTVSAIDLSAVTSACSSLLPGGHLEFVALPFCNAATLLPHLFGGPTPVPVCLAYSVEVRAVAAVSASLMMYRALRHGAGYSTAAKTMRDFLRQNKATSDCPIPQLFASSASHAYFTGESYMPKFGPLADPGVAGAGAGASAGASAGAGACAGAGAGANVAAGAAVVAGADAGAGVRAAIGSAPAAGAGTGPHRAFSPGVQRGRSVAAGAVACATASVGTAPAVSVSCAVTAGAVSAGTGTATTPVAVCASAAVSAVDASIGVGTGAGANIVHGTDLCVGVGGEAAPAAGNDPGSMPSTTASAGSTSASSSATDTSVSRCEPESSGHSTAADAKLHAASGRSVGRVLGATAGAVAGTTVLAVAAPVVGVVGATAAVVAGIGGAIGAAAGGVAGSGAGAAAKPGRVVRDSLKAGFISGGAAVGGAVAAVGTGLAFFAGAFTKKKTKTKNADSKTTGAKTSKR